MNYGLIGEHLPHSYSKEIHGRLRDYSYELCELTREELDLFMREKDFLAINVTIPYKETVIPYLTSIDEGAHLIGAVNTIVNRNGELFGYNSDFFGMNALLRRINADVKEKKVLILGTGGTAKTARAVCQHLGASSVVTVGRRAQSGYSISYEEAYLTHTDADYLINTTPVGMYPNENGAEGFAEVPIDISRFSCLKGVVDAIYNPLRTTLVMEALQRGIPAEGGLYMLVAQAVKASEIFLSDKLDPDVTDRVYRDIVREKENIVLTGMPSSGKSTVGRRLATMLDRPFLDSDEEISRREGMSIPEIFEKHGEAYFRMRETEVIRHLASECRGAVIATGGGAILKDENVLSLRRNGRIYFLNRSLNKLIPTSDRPLSSSVDAIKKRFAERYDRYVASCDFEVAADGSVEEVADAIRKDFYSEDHDH